MRKPYFQMVLLTFQNFGKTVFSLLSNYWKGHISLPFQTGNVLWKYIESYRNTINPLRQAVYETDFNTENKITPTMAIMVLH